MNEQCCQLSTKCEYISTQTNEYGIIHKKKLSSEERYN